MGKKRKRRSWLVAALVCVCGCSSQDADRLARIAQKTGQKLDHLTGGARARVAGGLQAARGSLGDATLDSRVSTRLRWDKLLADANVQVKTTGPGAVELTGKVADEERHRRAVDVANNTDGVVSVTDSLEVEAN